MEPKDSVMRSFLVLVTLLSLSCPSVLSIPYPEHFHQELGHHGGGHNEIVDYYSKPQYAFGYEVDGLDAYFRELSHGRWEVRDGDVVQGQYRVLLPDGRIQIVSYIADKHGYRPQIKYVNKGILPPPPPVYADVKVPHFYPHVEEVHPSLPPQPPLPIVEPYATYGPGYGYGFNSDPFVALGSNNQNQRITRVRVGRKRALRTREPLFRQDVERKRRGTGKGQAVVGKDREVSLLRSPPLASPSPTTVTLVSSSAGRKKGRRVTQPEEFKELQ